MRGSSPGTLGSKVAQFLFALTLTALTTILLGIPTASGSTIATPATSTSARIDASPTSTSSGSQTFVRGAGFAKNQRGYLVLEQASGTIAFRAGTNGAFTVSFPVAADLPSGTRRLIARSQNGATLAVTTIEVLSSPATPSPATTATPPQTPAPTVAPTVGPTVAPTTAPTVGPSASAGPSPTASAAPSATPTATPVSDAFVGVCGTSLCVLGQPWYLYGASNLGGLQSPGDHAALAVSARLNTLRIVNFLDEHGGLGDAPYDPARWASVDEAIAAARAAGLHVVLDLSTFRNLLRNAGLNPYTYDWGSFVAFVAQRSNTVTGARYADDATIALIAVAGEVEPLNTPANALGITSQQLTSFYERTFGQWRSIDSRHLLSTGGLLQLDWDSGIDWRAIFSLAGDDVCSIHDYSAADQTITTPEVAAFCAVLGKPWITEEFGWGQSIGDSTRAAQFSAMYSLQKRYAAAGTGFWNLGTQVAGIGGVGATNDVNPSTPLTWGVIGANAP